MRTPVDRCVCCRGGKRKRSPLKDKSQFDFFPSPFKKGKQVNYASTQAIWKFAEHLIPNTRQSGLLGVRWDGMDLSTVPLQPLPERQLEKRGQSQARLLHPLFSTPWPPWAQLDYNQKTNICALLLFIPIGPKDDILERCLDFSPPGAVCMMKQSHADQQ